MATITLSAPSFWMNGESGASYVVGYESNRNRIARYTMVAPPTGANHVDLSFVGGWKGSDAVLDQLYFYIGTDPDSHGSAGAGSEYTGILTRTNLTYNYTGSADVILMPNTTYYVWVFPTSTKYGWVYWSPDAGNATLEASGGAISTLTAGDGTLGVLQTLTVTRYMAEFTHTIVCTIGSASEVICKNSTQTAVAWTPSLELARQIPNAAKGTASLTITTYDGTTLIGSQTVTVTLTVPENIRPTASATWSDVSGASVGICVKLVSMLAVEVTGVGAYGSTITGATVTLGGKAYAGGVIMDVGNLDLVVTVNDSRGRTGTATYVIEVADYAPPSLILEASRCLEDGTPDEMGEYARVSVTGNVVEVNEQNTATLTVTYGGTTDTFEYVPGAINHVQIVPAPSVSTLAISATLADELLSATESMVLSIGYATVDYLAGGKGIAFGTTAKQEGFTCAMPAVFTGGVSGSGLGVESTDYPGCYYRMVDGRQEWLNPPYVVGKEYATTRRYLGKVVYSRMVDLGLSANGKKTSVDVLNQYSIVGLSGWINNRPMPLMAETLDNALSAWLFLGTGGTVWQIIIYCGSSMVNRQTYARIDYTKE